MGRRSALKQNDNTLLIQQFYDKLKNNKSSKETNPNFPLKHSIIQLNHKT